MKLWRVGVLLCLLGCAHASEAPAPTQPTARYTVTIFDNFGGAKVRVCLEGAPAHELVPIGDSAGHELRGAWLEGDTLEISRGRIRLSHSLHATCIDYETRFGMPMLRSIDSTAINLLLTGGERRVPACNRHAVARKCTDLCISAPVSTVNPCLAVPMPPRSSQAPYEYASSA